jgi:uncharacterized membrane protein
MNSLPYKYYLLSAFLFIAIDSVWLSINSNMYNKLVRNIQGSNLQLKMVPAILSYIFLLLGLFTFTFPNMKNVKESELFDKSLYYGGMLGLIIYAVYDFTNMAIFKNYTIVPAILDTLWGGTLYTLVTFLTFKILLKI